METGIKRNFSSPPAGKPFPDLLDHIRDYGVGNTLTGHGDVTPWTRNSLAARFSEFGYDIEPRTISFWFSHSTAPRRNNLFALARVISDETTRAAWTEALLAARRAHTARPPGDAADTPDAPEDTAAAPAPQPRRRPLIFLAIATLVVCAIAAAALLARPGSPAVTDIRLCTAAQIDTAAGVCTGETRQFPAATPRVYLSYEVHGVDNGAPLTRVWYRNAEEYRRRETRYGPPWPGYTWLGRAVEEDDSLPVLPPGNYTVRIIVADTIHTASFDIAAP